MSKQETKASTGRYAPSVSYNQQAPQPINQRLQSKVDVKSPDWVGTGIKALESFGETFAKARKADATAEAEAAIDAARNDLAREANKITESQRQGVISSSQAATAFRALKDRGIASGLSEKDVSETVGRYDGGLLTIDQSRQQKIMEADQKYWENQSQEIADKNPSLSRLQPSERTKLLIEMRTLTDDVNRTRSQISSMPEGEEKEAAKEYLNQAMSKNIKVNMAIQLGNMFAQARVVTEGDWIALRTQAIQACLDNGMDRGTAGVLVDEIAKSYSVTGDLTDIKRYYKDSAEFMSLGNKEMLAHAENKMLSMPGMALFSQLPAEMRAEMINHHYDELTKPFLSNVVMSSDGGKTLEGIDKITPANVPVLAQTVNNMNSSGLVNDYVRGKATGMTLAVINNINKLSPTSSASDAGVVALNSDGTRQFINFNLSRKQADALLRSADPEEVATGEFLTQELDKAEEQQWLADNIPVADKIVKTLTNLNGGDEEAYRANNSLKNSTNAASLRFNDNGELFISDANRDTLAELGYAFDKLPLVGGEYEEELSTINSKLSTLEPEMRKLVLTRAGYKQAEAGELPIAERRNKAEKAMSSAFGGKKLRDYGDTSEEFGAKALGIKRKRNLEDEAIAEGIKASRKTVPGYKGNIDIINRPEMKNEDGSVSTIKSMSFYDDQTGKEVLIPTIRVIDGVPEQMSEEEAINWYYGTGEHLGMFDTPEEATAMGKKISNFKGMKLSSSATTRSSETLANAKVVMAGDEGEAEDYKNVPDERVAEKEALSERIEALKEARKNVKDIYSKEALEDAIQHYGRELQMLQEGEQHSKASINTSTPLAFAKLSGEAKTNEQIWEEHVNKHSEERNLNKAQTRNYKELWGKLEKDIRKMREENPATLFHVEPKLLEERFLNILMDKGSDVAYKHLRAWKRMIEEAKKWNDGDDVQVYLNNEGELVIGTVKPKGPNAVKGE